MSLIPSDILQRIKQLRTWQENHEELIKRTKLLTNTSGNLTSASDYQTIEGLSAFDTSLNDETSLKSEASRNWDAQVISPTKSFNELLEKKLAEDPGPKEVAAKPKKPFLRKGAGLQRFQMKKPLQKSVRTIRRKTNSENNMKSDVTPLRAPDLSIKPKATWSKVEDSEHVRKINSIAEMDKPAPSEQTLYEKALEKELLIFEALEQKVENSSFCSTNSSVLRILSSTPSKFQRDVSEEKRVHWDPPNPQSHTEDEDIIETNLERKDIADILLRLKNLSENNCKPGLPSIIDASDEDKWSSTTTSETPSDNTSVTSSDLEVTLKTEKRDIGVGTDLSENCAICGDKLEKKIIEYEEKIRDIMEDRNYISEMKVNVKQKEQDFLKKKREFENERQNLLFEVESEKKKLNKEKQAFQMYMKESQNRPNKKERQEISNLKQEVADLTETLKLKESKNGMTQARLRNQIKQLEKENSNLKDEIEKLTKENAKLSAAQKINRKTSDSKILQEINKNITKLSQQNSKNKKTELSDDEDESEEEKYVQKSSRSMNEFETKRNRSLGGDNERRRIKSLSGSYEIRRNKSHISESEEGKPIQKRNISLDKEDSLLEMGIGMNKNQVDLQAEYENAFRSQPLHEISKRNDKIERLLEDGSKEVKYTNGNVKIVSSDGNIITIKYFNGDKQETNLINGTVKYYFSNKNIWQTTYADGLEVVEFPEGVIEKRHKNGRSEIILPDGVVQTTFPDGTQETKYKDGSMVRIKNDEKILLLPNGQKEIETKQYKRREYPDGTTKILYPDGTQETKYANGRIRIKDAKGTLIMDTQS